jgi:hypothetical protein
LAAFLSVTLLSSTASGYFTISKTNMPEVRTRWIALSVFCVRSVAEAPNQLKETAISRIPSATVTDARIAIETAGETPDDREGL